MAEDKKSFVLYTDSIGLIKQLPDDVSGRLFKHIFAYVNDENPTSDELLLNIAFEPIKQQLKRDLIKYEKKREQWSEAGKRSAEKRALNNSTVVDSVERSLTVVDSVATVSTVSVNDNVNVSVSVNDSVSDNVILLEKETKKDIRFKIPTVFEIQEYCTERQNTIDAENFFNFYESKGWMVGKAKMKDWKASVRTWEKSRNNNQQQIDLKNEPKIGRMPISVAIKNATGWGDIEI